MAGHIPKLSEKDFQNWIKANLALKITKDGAQNAVLDEISKFHRDTLNDLSPEQNQNNDLCSKCKNENILSCPTRGICIVKKGKCSFHCSQEKQYRPCPKQVCDGLREKLKQCHKFNFPSWKNTRAERWCQNPWELAKCYLPPDGYLGVSSISETDVNGIISVIMNHSTFANKVDMANCDQVREVTRRVRHSPDLSINDQDVSNFLDTLVSFLTSSSLFQGDVNAADSVQKLTKLKADSLTITTTDITKVLQDVIRENTRMSLQVVNERAAECANKLKIKLATLETVASKSLNEILTRAVDNIENKTKVAVDQIQSTTEQMILEVNKDIDIAKKTALTDIDDSKRTRISEADYQQLKTDFKSELLAFNKRYHSTIPISPLLEEKDTPLLGFYVQPAINAIEVQNRTFSGPAVEVRRPIKFYKDVFSRKSKSCENIYLTSEAGLGKTVFCKNLVLAWCHAHESQSSNRNSFEEEHLQTMQNFEYTFLISLRDSVLDCDVDDMIKMQIVQNLPQRSRYTADFLETLLHREKCLIILDGLDEWTHPAARLSACKMKQDGLPHRKARQNCTILTTTRSWKLSIVNLKSSQIDNHIEIESLDDDSSKQLIVNTVKRIINQVDNDDTEIPDIDKIAMEISAKSTPELEMNPLTLTYIVCMQHEGKSLGDSKCELYANIVDFLIHRGKIKCDEICVTDSADHDFETRLQSSVFRNCALIKSHFNYLRSLGKLAFRALFGENKEKSLVFDSVLTNSCLTERERKFSLSTGLLIQNELPGRLTTREATISFPHKTLQEFFAALFIFSEAHVNNVKESVLKKCDSLSTILEMSNTLIFLSGLYPERLRVLSKGLNNVINNDQVIIRYRQNLNMFKRYWNDYVKDLQNMYIACVKEIKDACRDPVYPLLEDVIIDTDRSKEGYFEMLDILTTNNIINIKSIRLTHSESAFDTQQVIKKLKLGNTRNLESLFLLCPVMEDVLEQVLANSVSTMKQVIVSSVGVENRSSYAFLSTLSDSSVQLVQGMKYMKCLQLNSVSMSHRLLESLISHLTHTTSMKNIALFSITCIDHGEKCLGPCLDLSQHSQLAAIGLGDLPVADIKINTSSLEECWIGKLPTSFVFSSYLNCLRDAKKLRYLMCDSRSENDLSTVFNTICLRASLKKIAIYNTDLQNNVINLLSDNASVELIYIRNTTMTSLSLAQLVQQLDHLQQSVYVELSDCTVTPVDEYERIIVDIKSSDRFQVTSEGEFDDVFGRKFNIFSFKKNKKVNIDAV